MYNIINVTLNLISVVYTQSKAPNIRPFNIYPSEAPEETSSVSPIALSVLTNINSAAPGYNVFVANDL